MREWKGAIDWRREKGGRCVKARGRSTEITVKTLCFYGEIPVNEMC